MACRVEGLTGFDGPGSSGVGVYLYIIQQRLHCGVVQRAKAKELKRLGKRLLGLREVVILGSRR